MPLFAFFSLGIPELIILALLAIVPIGVVLVAVVVVVFILRKERPSRPDVKHRLPPDDEHVGDA